MCMTICFVLDENKRKVIWCNGTINNHNYNRNKTKMENVTYKLQLNPVLMIESQYIVLWLT